VTPSVNPTIQPSITTSAYPSMDPSNSPSAYPSVNPSSLPLSAPVLPQVCIMFVLADTFGDDWSTAKFIWYDNHQNIRTSRPSCMNGPVVVDYCFDPSRATHGDTVNATVYGFAPHNPWEIYWRAIIVDKNQVYTGGIGTFMTFIYNAGNNNKRSFVSLKYSDNLLFQRDECVECIKGAKPRQSDDDRYDCSSKDGAKDNNDDLKKPAEDKMDVIIYDELKPKVEVSNVTPDVDANNDNGDVMGDVISDSEDYSDEKRIVKGKKEKEKKKLDSSKKNKELKAIDKKKRRKKISGRKKVVSKSNNVVIKDMERNNKQSLIGVESVPIESKIPDIQFSGKSLKDGSDYLTSNRRNVIPDSPESVSRVSDSMHDISVKSKSKAIDRLSRKNNRHLEDAEYTYGSYGDTYRSASNGNRRSNRNKRKSGRYSRNNDDNDAHFESEGNNDGVAINNYSLMGSGEMNAWFHYDREGSDMHFTDIYGHDLYYTSTLCDTTNAKSPCNLASLSAGQYMMRVTGALNVRKADVAFEFCGVYSGSSTEIVFEIDCDGMCTPLRVRNLYDVCHDDRENMNSKYHRGYIQETAVTLDGTLELHLEERDDNILSEEELQVLKTVLVNEFTEAILLEDPSLELHETVEILSYREPADTNEDTDDDIIEMIPLTERKLSESITAKGRVELDFRVTTTSEKFGVDGTQEEKLEGLAQDLSTYLHHKISSGIFLTQLSNKAQSEGLLRFKSIHGANMKGVLKLQKIIQNNPRIYLVGFIDIGGAILCALAVMIGAVMFIRVSSTNQQTIIKNIRLIGSTSSTNSDAYRSRMKVLSHKQIRPSIQAENENVLY